MATRKKTRTTTADAKADDNEELPDLEAAMEELQLIVARMEDGDQSLEATVKDFERGMELSKVCQENLKRAEARIDVLVKRADGDHDTDDFEPTE